MSLSYEKIRERLTQMGLKEEDLISNRMQVLDDPTIKDLIAKMQARGSKESK